MAWAKWPASPKSRHRSSIHVHRPSRCRGRRAGAIAAEMRCRKNKKPSLAVCPEPPRRGPGINAAGWPASRAVCRSVLMGMSYHRRNFFSINAARCYCHPRAYAHVTLPCHYGAASRRRQYAFPSAAFARASAKHIVGGLGESNVREMAVASCARSS